MKLSYFLLLLLGVCVLAGGVIGGQRLMEQNRLSTAAQKELDAQQSELKACEARLKRLHAAWRDYRKDHGGASPPSAVALLPRYLKSPQEFECPTALRWTKGGGAVDQGSINWKGARQPQTYALKWLSAGYDRTTRTQGDAAPLVVCSVHQEVAYRAAYKKAPPLGSFDAREMTKLVGPVASAPVLVARKNGSIGRAAPGDL